MTISIEELEEKIGKKIVKNTLSLGIDVASRTGWAIAKTSDEYVEFNYNFVDIDSKDFYFKLSKLIEYFQSIFNSFTPDVVVIEDSFLKFNVRVLSFLSKMEGALYTLSKIAGIKRIFFVFATTARKNLGIKGTCKKPEIKAWLKENLDLELCDEDAADAIVLALNGVIK